jgi:hypothetical protein
MNNSEWMLDNPCPECCRTANDPDRSLCRLYAYDIDCASLERYKGGKEGQKRLLEYIITICYDYDKSVYEEMMKQLEEKK